MQCAADAVRVFLDKSCLKGIKEKRKTEGPHLKNRPTLYLCTNFDLFSLHISLLISDSLLPN